MIANNAHGYPLDQTSFIRSCLYCIGCVSCPVLAGPPFQTADPQPTQYRQHELYMAVQPIKTSKGISGPLPYFELNYGALPNLELQIVAQAEFDSTQNEPAQYGYGDTELGMKYRFVQETPDHPMVGIFPLLEVPTGNASENLGNGGTQIFLPVWIQKKWSDWQSYGGGGYWINNAPGQKNYWFWGWELQHDLSPYLTLGAEIFYNTEQKPGQGSSSGFNIGGFYKFDRQNHLLMAIGKGLVNASVTDIASLYLGYEWIW